MKDFPESKEFARRVAEQLKARRLEIGASKLSVAQKAGLDQRTITFIEEGVNVPSLVTLHVICKSLGLDVAEVIAAAAKKKRSSRKRKPRQEDRGTRDAGAP